MKAPVRPRSAHARPAPRRPGFVLQAAVAALTVAEETGFIRVLPPTPIPDYIRDGRGTCEDDVPDAPPAVPAFDPAILSVMVEDISRGGPTPRLMLEARSDGWEHPDGEWTGDWVR